MPDSHAPRVWACGLATSHWPSPPWSPTVDNLPEPSSKPIQALQECFSNTFSSDNLLSRFFYLFFFTSLRSRGVLWILGPSSTPGKCFRGKVVIFLARSYFYGIFRIFRGLFELDVLLYMTHKKPSRGVVCYYYHNPRHVHRDCTKFQIESEGFHMLMNH